MHDRARCPFQRERLRRDGAFRAEVAYCAEKGLPHSEFLARWSNEDRAKLFASLADKADRCTLCGTADWEWLADAGAYEPIFVDCIGCRHIEGHRVSQGEQNLAGRKIVLISRREAERLKFDPTVARHGPTLKKRTRPKREK